MIVAAVQRYVQRGEADRTPDVVDRLSCGIDERSLDHVLAGKKGRGDLGANFGGAGFECETRTPAIAAVGGENRGSVGRGNDYLNDADRYGSLHLVLERDREGLSKANAFDWLSRRD